MKNRPKLKKTARMRLEEKLRRTTATRKKLVERYLPGNEREEYLCLFTRQMALAKYLKMSKYIDKRDVKAEKEYDRLSERRNELIDLHLPENARDRYYDLLVKELNLEEYLSEHGDNYIEKDAKFDWSRCPIAGTWDNGEFNRSLWEAARARLPCLIQDCPDRSNCWAIHSSKPLKLNL